MNTTAPISFLPSLKAGDRVDIITPGSKVPQSTLDQIAAYFKQNNLNPVINENMQGDDLLCANTDEMRFAHLKNALSNTDSKIVWCAAGGYGSTRLISFLEKMQKPVQQKIFIGLSDATALHIFFNQKWGWITIHGPGARQAVYQPIDPDCFKATFDLIFGKKNHIEFSLVPLNELAKKEKIIHAKAAGGNLSMVQTSLGTSWQLEGSEKIILLEDVNEKPYRIDRMLVHLQQGGIFENAAAILLGDFTNCGEANEKPLVEEILQRFANEIETPVLRCFGIGHGRVNYPLLLNTPAQLTLGRSKSTLFCNYVLN